MVAVQETFAIRWSLQRTMAKSTISRTRRAVTEEMSVSLVEKGGRYEV
jgi:hypothetical protein